jgi:IS5 family transposase
MERQLWNIVSRTITAVDCRLPKDRYTHSVGRIVRVYLWSVLNDRPVYWACKRGNWRGVRPPASLPDQSRMSRRLAQKDTQDFLSEVLERMEGPARTDLVKFIDGKPLPIARHSKDPDATFGRGAGGVDKGYKLHAIYGQSGRLLSYKVHPMNVDERAAAMELLQGLSDPGYLLADSNYDSNKLYQASAQQQQQLLAGRRYGPGRNIGHRAQSAPRLRGIAMLEGPSSFGRSLHTQRRQIETRFGNLSSFGGGLTHLPPWVRTLGRVRRFVTAKLIIRAAKNRLRKEGAA